MLTLLRYKCMSKFLLRGPQPLEFVKEPEAVVLDVIQIQDRTLFLLPNGHSSRTPGSRVIPEMLNVDE